MNASDVGCVSNKGQSYHVGTKLDCPPEVLLVFIRQSCNVYGNARKVYSLVVGELASDFNLSDDSCCRYFGSAKTDFAIVYEQSIAYVYISW
jgi:hypothetical protein